MPSIIEGYNYDIFISYRQKDNKGDRWVSKFVDALKTELEATFKEDISVYFDENPHDRLQETHNVDKSLEGKLNCLIFIPILSQTYCDPNSYAWQYEFMAFLRMAEQDRFGKDIKLRSGNVASRILPIRIHDLEQEDIKLFEKKTGSVLRAMDFVFKTASGVNRPLKANEDHPQDNLNKTFYSDQINKVANATKEIIMGIKAEPDLLVKGEPHHKESNNKDEKYDIRKEVINNNKGSINQKSKKWLIIVLSVTLFIIGVFAVFKIIEKRNKNNDIVNLEKSIAVLPFVNDSPDQENAYFINGIMDEILNNLQKIKDFRVLSRTSTEQYRGTNKPAIPKIAKELGVNYIVEGSGQKYGNTFRLRVQLIAAKKEKHLWGDSFEKEIKETKDIFKIQSQVAQAIASKLEATITPLEKQLIEKTPTDNLEAYRLYMQGNSLMLQGTEDAFRKAIDYYYQSVALDSGFAQAYAGLASAYLELGGMLVPSPSSEFIPQARKWALKTLEINKNLAETYFVLGSIKYVYEWDWIGAEQDFKKGMELNPNFVWGRIYYADFLMAMGRFEESIRIGEQTLKLSPLDPGVYNVLAFALFSDGQKEKGLELYNKSLKLNPDFDQTLSMMVTLYACEGQYDQAISMWEKELILFDNKIQKIPAISLGMAGYVFGMAGRRDEAMTLLHEFDRRANEEGYMNTSFMAIIYIGLGENQKALELLEKGFNDKEGVLVYLKLHSVFDSLRSDERFKELLRKMRFPE